MACFCGKDRQNDAQNAQYLNPGGQCLAGVENENSRPQHGRGPPPRTAATADPYDEQLYAAAKARIISCGLSKTALSRARTLSH